MKSSVLICVCVLPICAGCGKAAYSRAGSAQAVFDEEAFAPAAAERIVAEDAFAPAEDAFAPAAVARNADEPGPQDPAPEQLGAVEQTPKLVRRASLRLQTDDPAAAEPAVLAGLAKYGAYASLTEIYDHSRSYTIRVPEKAFQPLLEELKEMGRILYRSETAEDVTLRFYDLRGRLATKQALRETFQGYLKTAKSIEDIMSVETRLGELQNELDWMGKELQSLSNLIDYATIELEIRRPPSSFSLDKPTVGERVKGLFGSFGDFASTGLVLLLGAVIYGIPSLLILAALYWLLFGKIGVMKKLWRRVSGKGKTP